MVIYFLDLDLYSNPSNADSIDSGHRLHVDKVGRRILSVYSLRDQKMSSGEGHLGGTFAPTLNPMENM